MPVTGCLVFLLYFGRTPLARRIGPRLSDEFQTVRHKKGGTQFRFGLAAMGAGKTHVRQLLMRNKACGNLWDT